MIDLKAILEYQEADIKLRKTHDSIEKSDAQRRGKQAKIEFDAAKLLAVLGYLVLLSALAVFVFYRGLRRYSSSSLMAARM